MFINKQNKLLLLALVMKLFTSVCNCNKQTQKGYAVQVSILYF